MLCLHTSEVVLVHGLEPADVVVCVCHQVDVYLLRIALRAWLQDVWIWVVFIIIIIFFFMEKKKKTFIREIKKTIFRKNLER